MDKNSIISFLENHNTNFKLDKVLAAFEYLKNEYNVFKLLTAGSFGILILAEEIKSSDMRVIKCTQFNTIEDKKTLLQQAQIMQSINSDYVIKLYNCFHDEKQIIYSIFEYCPNGNLRDLLENNPKMENVDIPYIFSRILRGIKVLQDNNIAHCNLNPQNILLKSNNEAVIGDLNISLMIDKSKSFFDQGEKNMLYCAPEQLFDKITLQTDLFTCGVIVYEMCGFRNHTHLINFREEKFPIVEDEQKRMLLDLTKTLMTKDPKKRQEPKFILTALREQFPSVKQASYSNYYPQRHVFN